jgi:hypothetical protein
LIGTAINTISDFMSLGKIVYVNENITDRRGQRIYIIDLTLNALGRPAGLPYGIIGGSIDLHFHNGSTLRVGLTARHLFEWKDPNNKERWEMVDSNSLVPTPQRSEPGSSGPAGGSFSKSLCRTPYYRVFYHFLIS